MASVRRPERGSAVLAVLLFLATAAGLVIAATERAMDSLSLSTTIEARLKSDLLAETALAEVLAAYLGANDGLRLSLPPDGRVIRADIRQARYAVSVAAESGKVDLVHGDGSALNAALTLIYPLGVPPSVRSRVDRLRRGSNPVEAHFLFEKLSAATAHNPYGASQFLTLHSGQAKLDRETAHPRLRALLEDPAFSNPDIWGRQRPIYCISAAWMDRDVERPGRSMTVELIAGGRYRILARRTLSRRLTGSARSLD